MVIWGGIQLFSDFVEMGGEVGVRLNVFSNWVKKLMKLEISDFFSWLVLGLLRVRKSVVMYFLSSWRMNRANSWNVFPLCLGIDIL